MQEIFADAKKKMRAAGNMRQWTGSYPDDKLLRSDIERGFSYIIEEYGAPVATFVLAICDDPTYKVIYEGEWLDDEKPYGTIHRIASKEGVHGIMKQALDFAYSKIDNIRVDTHRDNLPMRNMLTNNGFTYCGIIYLANGDERLAYQKLLP